MGGVPGCEGSPHPETASPPPSPLKGEAAAFRRPVGERVASTAKPGGPGEGNRPHEPQGRSLTRLGPLPRPSPPSPQRCEGEARPLPCSVSRRKRTTAGGGNGSRGGRTTLTTG